MRMVALAALLFSASMAQAAVSKLTKEDKCKNKEASSLVEAFDPGLTYSSSELEQIVKFSSDCPGLKLPEAKFQQAQKKLKQSRFSDAKSAFENNAINLDWEILRERAKTAGYSDEQLQSMMKPYLDQAKKDCDPRDQRSKMPVVWNQGNQGWCYGYAAAGMASYILQEAVSPDAASMRYSIRNGWEGGNTLEALEINQQQGFCVAKEMAFSNDLQMAGYDPVRNSGAEIRELAEEFFTINGERKAAMAEDTACRELLSPMALDLAGSMKLTSTELVYILQKASGENMVKRLLAEKCVPTQRPLQAKFRNILLIDPKNPIKVMGYEKDSDYPQVAAEEARKQLQAALRANKVVGVGTFDYSVIGAGDKNHAMVIAGQKWNDKTQQCNLIIRNSWGPHCMPGTDGDVTCDGKGNYAVPIGKVLKHRFIFTLYD